MSIKPAFIHLSIHLGCSFNTELLNWKLLEVFHFHNNSVTMLNWWFKKGRQRIGIWIGFKPFKALISLMSGLSSCKVFMAFIFISILFYYLFWHFRLLPSYEYGYQDILSGCSSDVTYWSGNARHCVPTREADVVEVWCNGRWQQSIRYMSL